jgi:hypothetical protein
MLTEFVGCLGKTLLGFASFIVPLTVLAAPPAGVLDTSHASVQAVMAVQRDVTTDWIRQPEVLGTAVGVDANDVPVLTVYVDRDAAKAAEVTEKLPHKIRDIGVQVHPTDKFHPMISPRAGFGAGAGGHTASQTPPIQLGTSGGWSKDLANGYCCGGTLGSLVSIGGTQHILSNYHVLESDIVPGGNNTVATTGDAVIQPGLIDVNCTASNGQTVATLVKKSALPNSNVDCAIAKVEAGKVRTDGAILEIGTISHLTVPAAIKQAVKKSGRTTGLTRSSISGLNATIKVTYENECSGGTAFTKTFSGQIVITNHGSKFLNSGDSGSLMVEDVTTNPRAVGLLFAGSNTDAIANPINEVLAFLGATMVGN